MFGASLYHFYGEYKISISGSLQEKRSREFLYAFGIGSLTTIVVPAKFGVPIYPIGFLPYLAFLVLSARAVWSHRLLVITPSIAANQIVDTMSDALLVLDLKGVVRLVNRAAIETFGYTEKEIMGKPAGFLFRDKLFTWNFEKLVKAGRIEGHEVSFDAKNGERFTLSLSASILKDQSGQAMAVVCSLRDISKLKVAESELQKNRERLEEMVDERTKELKEAKNTIVNILDDLNQSYKNLEEAHEELKEIDRLKTDIISNVSHELRTPITITKASLELLQEEKSKKGRLKLHSMANSAMHRLEAGINNLVSAADLQKERKLLHIENVDFKALVEEVVKVMERRNVTGQIQIHTSVPKDLPSVKGDRKKLQLVLWNLIENAVKFSRKSGDKVSVALCVEDSHVKIGVSDRGIGIPQDRLEIIFSPFYQIDTSSTRDYEGMGMGLAVAASIIKAHGGKIWAKSSPQRGSTFYFSLPAAKKQLKRSAVQL
jgi:PAS domain S-box-containing protein